MEKIIWQHVHEPVDENTIKKIEDSFGISFPHDYKDCIMKFNGGRPKPNIFNFVDDGEGTLGYLLSFTRNPKIETVYGLISEYLPESVFPFATDSAGNMLCFDYRKDKHSPSIVFYNHEEDDEDAIELVCESFTDLLESLHYDEDEY